MDNAFRTLDFKPELNLSDDLLRERFRDAGKSLHPDAGGGAGEFAALREAMAVLSSPSRRLRHWLELRALPADPRGAIDNHLTELFGEIGEVCQAADSLARRRDETGSALVRALMEEETQRCRERVETAISTVDGALQRELSHFPEIAAATHPDPAKVARNLAFLEKWQASLKARFASLI